MLGDKAYSSRGIRTYLRRRRIQATIPEPADQKKNRLRRGGKGGRPPVFDPETYKQRNVVESNAPSTSSKVAIQQGVAAGGSQAPVVNSRSKASRVSMPHLVAVER